MKVLKTTVHPMWVARHPKPADTRGEQAHNADAHKLAVERLRNGGTDNVFIDLDTSNSTVSILHKNKVTKSGLPQQILANLRYHRLKEKIQRDHNWSDHQFHLIDWESYHAAIITIPRTHRLSILKLSHKLWNTNVQNAKFYGHGNIFSVCTLHPETWEHLFCCQDVKAREYREKANSDLLRQLEKVDTPDTIKEAIKTGLNGSNTEFWNNWSAQHPLNARIVEEQKSIGMTALGRGHLSRTWRKWYLSLQSKSDGDRNKKASSWLKNLILAYWVYSEAIWKGRNAVVHGDKSNSTSVKEVAILRHRAKEYYRIFKGDKHVVHASRAYLFDKPLLWVHQLPRDNLVGWLASVQVAI